jgi:hypothetical protein
MGAHLRRVPRPLARRCGVRAKYASHRVPILMGARLRWVPGSPPCTWAFLSSLTHNGFFSSLLIRLFP